VVTEPKPIPGGDPERKFMKFETVTWSPIDLNLVEPSLLTDAERKWLNDYHAKTREKLLPLVEADTKAWLENATRAI
jgi:Xaa-Pro aminopeptidase